MWAPGLSIEPCWGRSLGLVGSVLRRSLCFAAPFCAFAAFSVHCCALLRLWAAFLAAFLAPFLDPFLAAFEQRRRPQRAMARVAHAAGGRSDEDYSVDRYNYEQHRRRAAPTYVGRRLRAPPPCARPAAAHALTPRAPPAPPRPPRPKPTDALTPSSTASPRVQPLAPSQASSLAASPSCGERHAALGAPPFCAHR